MKKINVVIFLCNILVVMAVPVTAFAAPVWSNCQKVTAVTDYRAFDNAVYLTISPGVPGCFYGGVHRVRVIAGSHSATDETVKGALALGSTALVSGRNVTFLYDDSSPPVCNVRILALGGHDGRCP